MVDVRVIIVSHLSVSLLCVAKVLCEAEISWNKEPLEDICAFPGLITEALVVMSVFHCTPKVAFFKICISDFQSKSVPLHLLGNTVCELNKQLQQLI